jgi:hypothetical protein
MRELTYEEINSSAVSGAGEVEITVNPDGSTTATGDSAMGFADGSGGVSGDSTVAIIDADGNVFDGSYLDRIEPDNYEGIISRN